MAVEIPLKKKYLDQKSGGGGKTKTRTGSGGGKKIKVKAGTGPRRKSYGPF